MKEQPILQIIGAGGFAREIMGYWRTGFGSCKAFADGWVNTIDDADPAKPTVIAIGDPKTREMIADKLQGFNFDRLLMGASNSPLYAPGIIICPGTRITVSVVIGAHVIVNLNCTIGHDCQIMNFTTISPGANISGNVKIGKRCYIGTGAAIREKITICDDVTIGAGGVVVKDITEPGVYVGNPVKRIK